MKQEVSTQTLLILITSLLIGSRAMATAANEPPPLTWAPGTFAVSTQSEYFMSSANFDKERGSWIRLPNGGEFTSFENRLKGRFNLTSKFSFFGGAGLTRSTAKNATTENTNTRPTAIFGGANMQLWRKGFYIVPEIEGGYPIDTTDETQAVPLTSDGVPYARAGVFFFKPLSSFRFGGYLGLYYPVGELAKRLHYELTADWFFMPGWSVGVGIDGYESVIGDNKTYEQRAVTAAIANATSQRFYSFEPSLLEGRLWLGYRFSRTFSAKVGYAKTLNGINTAEGQSVLFSLMYNSARPTRVSSSRTSPAKVRPERTIDRSGFEVETEATDKVFEGDALDQTEQMLENKNQLQNGN